MSTEPVLEGPGATPDDVALIEKLATAYTRIRTQLARVIVGQDEVLEQLLIALFSNGHCILEGVPGLAKTLMISTLARCLSLSFSRVQFTPDLMPSDITGTEVIEEDKATGARSLRFVKGPVFAHVVLADEINRTPPKTQAALLEAMQERQVTAAGFPHRLPQPFYVLATQNPIEQEGTYPLPEAQLDRFMLKIRIDYPDKAQERAILDRMAETSTHFDVAEVVSPEDILAVRQVVDLIYIDDKIKDYIVNLVLATRQPQDYGLQELKGLINFGASPRASIYLALAAKAMAFLQGRGYVTPQDVKSIGMDVLRHRVIVSYEAEAQEKTSEDIIQQIFDNIEVP